MATIYVELLTLDGAKIAIAASEKKAREIGVDMNIAIVDASTHLLHFSRMPNAKITSISIAMDKAFTAAGHKSERTLTRKLFGPAASHMA